MNETVFTILLIAVAVAMPAWMARRKANARPWLVGWLLVVGLLILPFGLTVWLHPEWLNHPVPFLAKHLVLIPFFLSLCALGGGLLYLMAPLAIALFLGGAKALGEAFKDVEWGNNAEDQGYGGITRKEVENPFDFYNDFYYEFYRKNNWDDD